LDFLIINFAFALKTIFYSAKSAFFMKKILAFAFVLTFFTPLSMWAQHNHIIPCGVTTAEDDEIYRNMMETRARNPHFVMPRNTVYIPVWFHLAARTDGTGRVAESKVLDMLCEWNRLNESNATNMQFYIRGFNYINNDQVYNIPKAFAAEQRMIPQKKNNGMNIFLCGTADDGQGTGTTLAYFSPANDWIVCAIDQVSTATAGTMAHEAGHFFSLPHPFRGWDADGFCPTPAAACAPRTINFNGIVLEVEKVARTGAGINCDVAGDGFCDTPADYNMNLTSKSPAQCGYTVNGCSYVGIAKDPDCVPVDPDETLLMGYYLNCSAKFTTQQKAAMMNNYTNAGARAYLRSGNVAPSLTNLTVPTLTTPANNSTTYAFNSVGFSWSAVPNALGYIIDVAPTTSFLGGFSINATTNTLVLNNANTPAGFLQPGRTLHWRVRPYGTYKVCATQGTTSVVSPRSTFILGAINKVADIDGATNLTVSPNPLSKSQVLNVTLQSDKTFEAQIKVYNIAGQVVQSEARNFGVGLSQHTLDVANLGNGFYILAVESATGVLKQRFTIQE
jgi:Secretion system C-terminal sorting domain